MPLYLSVSSRTFLNAAFGMRLHFCLRSSGSVQVYIGCAAYTLTVPSLRVCFAGDLTLFAHTPDVLIRYFSC